MKLIKVAASVLNQTPLDWEGNRRNISAAIHLAREQNVSVLCLPELCITGYGCEDAFLSPGVQRQAYGLLMELVAETTGMIVSFGLPVMFRSGLYNVAGLAVDGQLVGMIGKQNLAGEGIHYEPRWFKAWPEDVRSMIEISGNSYPIGDYLFDCGGVWLGFEVCEDAWVANRPGADLARRGVDIILNPSASHFAFGKHEVRKRFVLEGSRAFSVTYIYANLVGNESGRAIYDGDAMLASAGKLIANGPRFSFQDALVTAAVVDIDETRMSKARSGSFRPDLSDQPTDTIRVPFDFPKCEPQTPSMSVADWETSDRIKEEEFARAVSLGLFDYMRKSRSKGYVVSLSGGADSSAVVTLIWSMAHLAFEELGSEGMIQKLWYVPDIELVSNARDLVGKLLTCVYQSTKNSGEVTRSAAHGVAQGVGATHYEFDVDEIVDKYTSIVSESIGRELTWETDDLALQNIQARVRAPSVWMLANINGALLLSTSNRSEAAVGYATMDGDTAGGLSPIAGIDKAFLRRWLVWMEKSGVADSLRLPSLKLVNDQQPTAELRPPGAGQTDESDLMPYAVLDSIERAAIRDKLVPVEVFRRLASQLEGYDRGQIVTWVERFFRLWSRNQWKRERYAPSFHLDDENLDPKTWCRFPILSGGFESELADLRHHADQT